MIVSKDDFSTLFTKRVSIKAHIHSLCKTKTPDEIVAITDNGLIFITITNVMDQYDYKESDIFFSGDSILRVVEFELGQYAVCVCVKDKDGKWINTYIHILDKERRCIRSIPNPFCSKFIISDMVLFPNFDNKNYSYLLIYEKAYLRVIDLKNQTGLLLWENELIPYVVRGQKMQLLERNGFMIIDLIGHSKVHDNTRILRYTLGQ